MGGDSRGQGEGTKVKATKTSVGRGEERRFVIPPGDFNISIVILIFRQSLRDGNISSFGTTMFIVIL